MRRSFGLGDASVASMVLMVGLMSCGGGANPPAAASSAEDSKPLLAIQPSPKPALVAARAADTAAPEAEPAASARAASPARAEVPPPSAQSPGVQPLSAPPTPSAEAAASTAGADGSAQLLGTVAGRIQEIALTDHNVIVAYRNGKDGFKTAGVSIARLPLTGGAPSVLYEGGPAGVTASADTVFYWTAGNSYVLGDDPIWRVPETGGTSVEIAKGASPKLALTSNALVWATPTFDEDRGQGPSVVMSVPLMGGGAKTIATLPDVHIQALAVDESFAYMGLRKGIHPKAAYSIARLPLAGGPVKTIIPDVNAGRLLVHGKQLFVAPSTPLSKVGPGSALGLIAYTTSGGAPTRLAGPGSTCSPMSASMGPFTVDDASFYWFDLSGTLTRCDLKGGGKQTLSTRLASPAGPVLKNRALYYTDSQSSGPGKVYRLALP